MWGVDVVVVGVCVREAMEVLCRGVTGSALLIEGAVEREKQEE